MQMMNRAIEDADAFRKMMQKVEHGEPRKRVQVVAALSTEVRDWNAEVDRKRAAKMASRLAKAIALACSKAQQPVESAAPAQPGPISARVIKYLRGDDWRHGT